MKQGSSHSVGCVLCQGWGDEQDFAPRNEVFIYQRQDRHRLKPEVAGVCLTSQSQLQGHFWAESQTSKSKVSCKVNKELSYMISYNGWVPRMFLRPMP